MKSARSLLLFLLISCTGSMWAQGWGIGFRLGDPSGLTVKKYNGQSALELNIGRAHPFSNDQFYYDFYDRWYDGKHFGYTAHQFLGYRSTVPLGIQLHWVKQKSVKSAEGLEWYLGLGAQMRWQTVDLAYRYKVAGDNDWYYVEGERVTGIDLGVDGVLGLEYKFKNAPLSLFMDGTLFMEVVDDPFLFWPQFGFGARYRF